MLSMDIWVTKEYLNFINKLRKNIDNLAITADVIVGFPGETEEDFQDTVDFINEVHFQELHVFPFSSRTGTVASRMKNQINGTIKKVRVKQLLELSNSLKDEYINKSIGFNVEGYKYQQPALHLKNPLLLFDNERRRAPLPLLQIRLQFFEQY